MSVKNHCLIILFKQHQHHQLSPPPISLVSFFHQHLPPHPTWLTPILPFTPRPTPHFHTLSFSHLFFFSIFISKSFFFFGYSFLVSRTQLFRLLYCRYLILAIPPATNNNFDNDSSWWVDSSHLLRTTQCSNINKFSQRTQRGFPFNESLNQRQESDVVIPRKCSRNVWRTGDMQWIKNCHGLWKMTGKFSKIGHNQFSSFEKKVERSKVWTSK